MEAGQVPKTNHGMKSVGRIDQWRDGDKHVSMCASVCVNDSDLSQFILHPELPFAAVKGGRNNWQQKVSVVKDVTLFEGLTPVRHQPVPSMFHFLRAISLW